MANPPTKQRHRGPVPEFGYRFFHSYEQPFSEFPALDHVNEAECTAAHVLPEHAHPTLELCYFHAGHARWVAGGTPFDLGPGDLFIAHPGELHGGKPDPRSPNHNFAIGFDPAHLPNLPRTGEAGRDLQDALSETTTLASALMGRDQRVIHGARELAPIARRILSELDRNDADPQLRGLCLLMVQILLVELVVVASRAAIETQMHLVPVAARPDLKRLMTWLPSRLADPPSLAEMAEVARLSPTHLAAVCKRELGCTPHEHVTNLRINEAARRLRETDASITEIAIELGFASSQYFSVVFRRARGLTPTQWRGRP